MNQAEIMRLVSGLRIKIPNKPIKLKGMQGGGERGTIENLRPSVTSLILHERIEAFEGRGKLTREYTERLISEAILHGDRHKETMEVASWWLDSDKSAIHKLFKVLVPRFKDYTSSYTKLFYGPKKILTQWDNIPKTPERNLVVLELKGNPYPNLAYSNSQPNKRAIHNVLLSEAAKDYRLNKKPSST